MQAYFKPPFWVLGKSVSGITSIEWIGTNLESFANCGTLIVDLTTLSDKVLTNISQARMIDLTNEIGKRFKSGGNIICVLQKNLSIKREGFWAQTYF